MGEGLGDDLQLLLEQLPVGVGVQHRRPECLHLSGVVAASHSEYDAALAQNVGHGEIFSQAKRVPHGDDVEPTTKFQPLCLSG